jgi:hypothetical protein
MISHTDSRGKGVNMERAKHNRRMKYFYVAASVVVFIFLTLLVLVAYHVGKSQQNPKMETVLDIENANCVLISPDGTRLKDSSGKLINPVIPKGTVLEGGCIGTRPVKNQEAAGGN